MRIMYAVANVGYGNTSQLQSMMLPKPVPQKGELLVRTLFAGVNHVDWQIREGWFRGSTETRFPFVPGWDVCGVVDVVPPGTRTTLSSGDLVYAYCRNESDPTADGAYAQYVAVRADSCAAAPRGVPAEILAVLPLVCLTAGQMVAAAKPSSCSTVALFGASGAVGRQVLALLVEQGLAVTAVAHGRHIATLRAAGARKVFEWDALRSPSVHDQVDIVMDCGVGLDVSAASQLLRPGGSFVTVVVPPDLDQAEQTGIKAVHLFSRPGRVELEAISGSLSRGLVPLPNVEVLPLRDAALAQEKLRAGHPRRLCLQVADQQEVLP